MIQKKDNLLVSFPTYAQDCVFTISLFVVICFVGFMELFSSNRSIRVFNCSGLVLVVQRKNFSYYFCYFFVCYYFLWVYGGFSCNLSIIVFIGFGLVLGSSKKGIFFYFYYFFVCCVLVFWIYGVFISNLSI